MKACLNCHGKNLDDGIFCTYCGTMLLSAPPDNSPREVLRFLVQKHPECVKSVSLLNGLLSDYLANAKAECFLLCLIAENGIPERLQKAGRLSAHLFCSLSNILTTQCFIQPKMAGDGILIWAYALGLKVDDISSRQAGQVLSLSLPKGIALELVWCPPGSFMMGSPEGELGRFDNEAQHRVTLTKGFWIGKYAVTQEQFEAVTGKNYSSFIGARRPVESYSWNDAMAFCSEVQLPTDGSIPSGYKMTLPTEAQWEYACRAGTTSALNNGLELTSKDGACANLAQLAWYKENSGFETHEVGQKSPNAWGLYDMHGNVWEWCLDWYGSYGGAATDPTGPSTGSYRVVRGGSWFYGAEGCRSAFRSGDAPSDRGNNLGLRPVLAPVQ